MKSKFRNSFPLAVTISALLAAPFAFAATLTWDNGAATGNWNTTDLNWTGSVWSNATPDDAVFGTSGVGTVALTEAITAGSVTINTAGYTITGSTIALSGGATALASNETSAVNSNVTLTTAAGTITSSIGTLTLGGTLDAGSLGLTIAGAGNTTVGNAIANGTTLAKSGAGILTLTGTNGFASATISGGTITGGTLTLSAGATALTSSATSAVNSNVTLTTAAGTITSSAGTLTLGGTLDAGSLGLTFAGAGNTTVSSAIANGTTLTKSGTGTLILGGTNTYSGATSIGAGIVQAGSATGLSPNSDVSFTAGSTRLILAGFNSTIGAITGTAGVVENANAAPVTLTLGNTNASGAYSSNLQDGTGGGALAVIKTGSGAQAITNATFTGGLTINQGTWQLGGVNGLGNGPVVLAAGAKLSSNSATARVLTNTLNTLAVNGSITLGDATNTGQMTLPGAVTLSSSPTITVPANNTQILSGAVGGTSFTKAGAGTLTLSNASNNYSGGTFISAGRLVASAAGGALSTGTITFDGSAQFQPASGGAGPTPTFAYSQGITLNNGAVASIGGNAQFWFAGNVTGDGGITASTFSFGSVVFLMGTNNTFTGPIVIGPGGTGGNWYNVQVASLADSPTANGKIQLANGSTYSSSGRTDGFIWLGTTNLVLNNRQLEVASTTTQGGSFYNNSSNNSSITINTTVTGALGSFTAGTRMLSLGGTSTGANTIAGAIVDGTSVTLAPTITAGTWNLSGSNTYTGPTRTIAGTLIVNSLANGGSPSSIGQSTSATGLVLAGGTLKYAPISAVGGAGHATDRNFAILASTTLDASGTGALLFNAPTGGIVSPDVTGLTFNATGANKVLTNLSSTADLAVGMRVTGTGIAASSTIASIDSASQVTLTSSANVTAGTGVAASFGYPSARTLTLTGSSTDANSIAGNLQDSTATGSGVLSLTKSGAGKWVLSGNNTYTGATTVSAGTLLINGNQSTATGAVNVNGTSTFGGAGTVGGTVTVAAGAFLTPGSAAATAGTLTVIGGLNISAQVSSTGKLNYDLVALANPNDKIAVTGTLTIGTGVLGFGDFVFTNLGGLQAGTYKLITSGGISGTLDGGNLTGTIGTFNGALQITGNDLELVVTSASGYTSWQTANSTAQTINLDHDGDGVSNGVEYFLGGTTNTTGFTSLPGVVNTLGTLSVTWTKSGTYPVTAVYGTDFVVESSDTLIGTWSTETVGGNVTITGSDVKYTFPAPLGSRKFARLRVTGP